MKANKAPERIYIHPTLDNLYGMRERSCNDEIEYTRTDAFIEKACEFINKVNLYLYHCISEECNLVDTDEFIKDFKKYMKEE